MNRQDTRQRKQAFTELKTTAGIDWILGTLVRVIRSGKQVLDEMMLEMVRMVAESVMLMEREEVAEPGYYPTDPAFKKWVQRCELATPRSRHPARKRLSDIASRLATSGIVNAWS
jgi:hypothetical protein